MSAMPKIVSIEKPISFSEIRFLSKSGSKIAVKNPTVEKLSTPILTLLALMAA